MEKYEIATSELFDEMVSENGINSISIEDITDELNRQNMNIEGNLIEWDYENGKLYLVFEV